MIKFLAKVCLLAMVISFIPSTGLPAEPSPDEIKMFASQFKVRDPNIVKNIAKSLKKKYGITDLTKERIIDVLAKKYNTSVEKLQKLGPIMFNIGTLAPANTPWIKDAIDTVIPFLTWESRGTMTSRIYPGGTMGEDADILRKMRLGELQGCGCTAQGVMNAAPELSVLTLPFLFDNYNQVDCVLDGMRKDIESVFEKHGYILVGLIHTGFFYMFAKNDVTSLELMKKQKVMTWFGNVESTFLNELGIKPIPIAVTDVVSSLQTGITNFTISPPVWLIGVQGFVYVKYFIEPPVFYSPAAIFLDKKQIDTISKKYPPGLADDITAIFVDFMKTYEPEWRSDIASFEKQSLEAFKKSGIKEIRFSDTDLNTMKADAKKTWEKLSVNVYPKELLDKVIRQRDKCSSPR